MSPEETHSRRRVEKNRVFPVTSRGHPFVIKSHEIGLARLRINPDKVFPLFRAIM